MKRYKSKVSTSVGVDDCRNSVPECFDETNCDIKQMNKQQEEQDEWPKRLEDSLFNFISQVTGRRRDIYV